MFREEDLEKIIFTDSDEKKEALYLLYLYHVNYDDEPNEKKREIREYYEKNLRYKGAFYKDAKTFRVRGNPLEWETSVIKRFKPQTRSMDYYRGMQNYDSFVYPTSTLTRVELSKRVNILLVGREENLPSLNLAYMNELRDELQQLKRTMQKVDNKKGRIKVTFGWQKPEVISLSDLQIIFKINTNDYIRYISTNFMSDTSVIEVAMNRMQNYLAGVTKIKDLDEIVLGDYEEHEEDFFVENCILERIIMIKRTNVYDSYIKRRQLGDYDLDIENLRSIKIEEMNKE